MKNIDLDNLSTEYEYYVVSTESSYYVPKGQIEKVSKAEALKAKETGKHAFAFSDNMHWDIDILPCKVVKKEIKYSLL